MILGTWLSAAAAELASFTLWAPLVKKAAHAAVSLIARFRAAIASAETGGLGVLTGARFALSVLELSVLMKLDGTLEARLEAGFARLGYLSTELGAGVKEGVPTRLKLYLRSPPPLE